ncbi:hypothetical protein Droror1_Dr00009201 [Drosera rotundifolia]
MPTFTAVALERLLDQSSSKPAPSSDPPPPSLNGGDARSTSMRPAAPLSRRNSTPAETERSGRGRSAQLRPISPALYVTPETVRLPDSPISEESSQSADLVSPYVVYLKPRGRRRSKSVSEQNVAFKGEEDAEGSREVENRRLNENEAVENDRDSSSMEMIDSRCVIDVEVVNGDVVVDAVEENVKENGVIGENDGLDMAVGEARAEGEGETENFYDIQDSLSFASSTDVEDNNVERSGRTGTPGGEFFDAWEELSSDSGRESRRSFHDLEAEVWEMRFSLLMEIEKRKQAEESLNNMQNQWQMLREKMKSIGLVLPPDSFAGDGKPDVDSADEICRQFHMTRLLSECIGMEVAKDEAEATLEVQLETKNFEIARLNDRLHYYETINREMSQRNQEAIERARHDRLKRKRRLQWVWGSVGVAITVGSIALAWSYAPGGKASSSMTQLEAADHDTAAGH